MCHPYYNQAVFPIRYLKNVSKCIFHILTPPLPPCRHPTVRGQSPDPLHHLQLLRPGREWGWQGHQPIGHRRDPWCHPCWLWCPDHYQHPGSVSWLHLVKACKWVRHTFSSLILIRTKWQLCWKYKIIYSHLHITRKKKSYLLLFFLILYLCECHFMWLPRKWSSMEYLTMWDYY